MGSLPSGVEQEKLGLWDTWLHGVEQTLDFESDLGPTQIL